MPEFAKLVPLVLRRDGGRCQACGVPFRPLLAVHHTIPLSLGGRDVIQNLTTLCANCHRSVHWLAVGDRSLDPHAYGLGPSRAARQRLIRLARRIRRRRLRVIGPARTLITFVTLESAMNAVIVRNGLDRPEARLFRRCFTRALGAIASGDLKLCSVRLARRARFISVIANNHLALRAPAWNDDRQRIEGDILLIWPQSIRLSVFSANRFKLEAAGRFKLIPHTNLSVTRDECLNLTRSDWRVYRQACHDALTLARTSRRTSNIRL